MQIDLAIPSAQAVPVSPAAIPIELRGVCSINGGPDMACRTVELSASSLILTCDTDVAPADKAIVTLPRVGLIEATVAQVFEHGFELQFDPAPQSKLGILLTWLEGETTSLEHAGRELRGFDRIVPIKRVTTLKHDGESSIVRLIDLSRSGAAFTTTKSLAEGERVTLGAHPGMVVRLVEGGAAVRFDDLICETHFDVLIDLDAPTTPNAA